MSGLPTAAPAAPTLPAQARRHIARQFRWTYQTRYTKGGLWYTSARRFHTMQDAMDAATAAAMRNQNFYYRVTELPPNKTTKAKSDE